MDYFFTLLSYIGIETWAVVFLGLATGIGFKILHKGRNGAVSFGALITLVASAVLIEYIAYKDARILGMSPWIATVGVLGAVLGYYIITNRKELKKSDKDQVKQRHNSFDKGDLPIIVTGILLLVFSTSTLWQATMKNAELPQNAQIGGERASKDFAKVFKRFTTRLEREIRK